MNQQTALKFNKLNHEFYQKVALFFDSSRQYNWDGWEREELLKILEEIQPLKVLDLGCGNGRYLKTILNFEFKILNYDGIDSSDDLLKKARASTSLMQFPLESNVGFHHQDLLLDNWEKGREGKFNLVVAFGLLHHIPSQELRLRFFERVFSVLEDGGYFVFTVWNFEGSERQKNKIADPNSPTVMSSLSRHGLTMEDLDPNDYLLSWNRGVEAIRYAHAYTHEEIQTSINNSMPYAQGISAFGGKINNYFRADGKEGDLNTYYIVQKATSLEK
jgi:tRNA (uracil-5-)-methyltransferase TRM9